jgi:uncharacterized Rmd1/YagE family protein
MESRCNRSPSLRNAKELVLARLHRGIAAVCDGAGYRLIPLFTFFKERSMTWPANPRREDIDRVMDYEGGSKSVIIWKDGSITETNFSEVLEKFHCWDRPNFDRIAANLAGTHGRLVVSDLLR